MAEVLLGQFTLTPLFQLAGPTTLGFIRVEIQPQQVEIPLGWGYELMVVNTLSQILHPRIQIFPWSGPTGTGIDFPSIVRTPITPGLPRRVGIRSLRQVGIPVNVYAGNEIDYF